MGIAGLTDDFFCVYLYNLLNKSKKSIIVVLNSLYEVNLLYSNLSNYTDDVFTFPMDDFLTSEALAISPDLKISRLNTLSSLVDDAKKIIITNLMGYLRYLPTKENFSSHIINLALENEIDPISLSELLISSGYERTSLVNKTGEFALRGYVLDVFPLGEELPFRIEFFGDSIDSIRTFDIDSQKSIDKVNDTWIKTIEEVDTFVSKNSLSKLNDCHVLEPAEKALSVFPIELFCLKRLAYNPKEGIVDKLVNVYAAMNSIGATVFIIIHDGA